MRITPQNVLAKFNRQDHWTGVVTTHSSIRFNVFDPKVDDVVPEDVCWGLSTATRFAGHTEPLLTVAEHSITVMHIVQAMGWADGVDGLTLRKQAFLHDAQEGYLYDLPATYRSNVYVLHPKLKKVINWTEWEDMVAEVIHERVGVPMPTGDGALAVRAADLIACNIEKSQLPSLTNDDWGLPPVPAECRYLKYEFWDQKTAFERVSTVWDSLGLNP